MAQCCNTIRALQSQNFNEISLFWFSFFGQCGFVHFTSTRLFLALSLENLVRCKYSSKYFGVLWLGLIVWEALNVVCHSLWHNGKVYLLAFIMSSHSHCGSRGGRLPSLTAKNCQKSGKIGRKSGKSGKKREKIGKWGKIGKVLSLCPSWQIVLATLLCLHLEHFWSSNDIQEWNVEYQYVEYWCMSQVFAHCFIFLSNLWLHFIIFVFVCFCMFYM